MNGVEKTKLQFCGFPKNTNLIFAFIWLCFTDTRLRVPYLLFFILIFQFLIFIFYLNLNYFFILSFIFYLNLLTKSHWYHPVDCVFSIGGCSDIGRCSVHRGDTMISPRCTEHPLMYSWYPPNVLTVFPRCSHDIPPMFLWYPADVLNTHYTGWMSICGSLLWFSFMAKATTPKIRQFQHWTFFLGTNCFVFSGKLSLSQGVVSPGISHTWGRCGPATLGLKRGSKNLSGSLKIRPKNLSVYSKF